jgi:hypothetical protein
VLTRLAAALAIAGSFFAASSGHAEDPAPETWQFSIAPYLWAMSLDGDVTVRGNDAGVDASFVDILQQSDSIIGLLGHGEARKGNWGLYVDGVYARLGAKANPRAGLKIKSTAELSFLEGGAFYRVGQWDLGNMTDAFGGGMTSVALETYAGARYTSLNLSLDLDNGVTQANAGSDKSWVDPLLGARAILDLTERLQLIVGGDIGGFGVGSDMTWSAIGVIGYNFSLLGLDSTAVIGYKALHQDYQDGSGAHAFHWDMTVHGPITGVIIKF